MRKRIDMTGQRFDRLTVICYDHRDSGDSLWRCRCDCGNEVVVRRKNLLSGLTKSCGCLKREIGVEKAKKMREVQKNKQTEDLTGKVFGNLTVIQPERISSYLCRCSCGREGIYSAGDLLTGRRRSCGCGPKGSKPVNIDGQRFGKLVVLRRNQEASTAVSHLIFDCRCDCGNEITVYGRELRSGRKTSCGCDRRTTKNIAADFARKHGCSVCADKKYCDRTICKYENEFARRKKNEMEAKEEC